MSLLLFLVLKHRTKVLIKEYDFSSWPSPLHHKDTSDLYGSLGNSLKTKGVHWSEEAFISWNVPQRSKLLLWAFGNN